MLTRWFFRECHSCGHLEHITNANYDEEKKTIIDPDLSKLPKVAQRYHICRICGGELEDSPYVYIGEVETQETASDIKERIKDIRNYQKQLFEQYAGVNETTTYNFHRCASIEQDEYKRELRVVKDKQEYTVFSILRGILLFIPAVMWITARDLFGVFKKDMTDMMNAKGSTIIFWDDCNHHKK